MIRNFANLINIKIMSTKIQINSLEALERLIGNDNETELELRNAVVQEFAKRHLKFIANDKAVKALEAGITAELKSFLLEEAKSGNLFKRPFLKEPFATIIREQIEKNFAPLIREMIEPYFAEVRQKVEAKLNDAADDIFTRIKDEQVERTIQAKVQERLRQALKMES